jgi:hypothetical protein
MTTRRSRRRLSRATDRRVLIVLFVPSVDRESRPIEQEAWLLKALEFFGRLFGGATAFPRARGVWRDDDRDGHLVWDEPVVLHCYAAASDVEREQTQLALGSFCAEMCRGANQGEVGLVIDNVYHAVKREDTA